jgi:(-)-alpha-terpineol synthase
MNETGASEEDAREHIRSLISATWKKLNGEAAASSPFSQTFIEIIMNLVRMAQCIYLHGDGIWCSSRR